jgi:hypothetical protein
MPMVSPRFEPDATKARPSGFSTACLISEAIARRSERKAVRCPPWKLIYDPFFGALELYDIKEDPSESDNLIELHPEVAKALTDTLLVMSKYYPGGWCIAWRNPASSGKTRGTVILRSELVEAVGHNFFPEIDHRTDSLVVGGEWTSVGFAATGEGWQGLEIRMTSGADAEIDFSAAGRSRLMTSVGPEVETVSFPISVSPSRARIDRRHLHRLFEDPDVECAIYWIEPGTDPVAKRKHHEELKQQLKSIGYIE